MEPAKWQIDIPKIKSKIQSSNVKSNPRLKNLDFRFCNLDLSKVFLNIHIINDKARSFTFDHFVGNPSGDTFNSSL